MIKTIEKTVILGTNLNVCAQEEIQAQLQNIWHMMTQLTTKNPSDDNQK